MVETIDRIESFLVRAEGWVLVVCVVAMLVLAAYNVFYRNVLSPLQTTLATSGPAPTAGAWETESGGGDDPSNASPTPDAGGGTGFGGGFGAGSDEQDATSGSDDESAGGFEGGFGGGAETSETSADAGRPSPGFEGGFESGGEEPDAGGESSGFGGGFSGSDEGSRETTERRQRASADEETGGDEASTAVGGPPAEGSAAAMLIAAIEAIKLSWVDAFLRHMVLVVGFLGAMIAVRRREHITIDAVGQFVSERRRFGFGALTGLFGVGVCIFLAKAGADLVMIEGAASDTLLPGVQVWVVQLVFPLGFGFLALHFGLRALADGWRAYTGEFEESARETDIEKVTGGESDPEGGGS